MWYSEKEVSVGHWCSALSARRPSGEMGNGRQQRLRRVCELPASYQGTNLAMLRELFDSDMVPTHMHVASGRFYRVTGRGRLEVTGDEAFLLVEYENASGEKFAQSAERFNDGRFAAVEGC